jgi:phosphatidylserine/phosphatidylglycerophosphate/cardiolipin synthase-like enzyme
MSPLPDAREAFAARVLSAQAAERSLDAQSYIWHQDMMGTVLFEARPWRRAAACASRMPAHADAMRRSALGEGARHAPLATRRRLGPRAVPDRLAVVSCAALSDVR